MAEVAPARFTGFDKAAMQFWHELAAEMNREWFAENKQRYEQLWVAPMTALLGEVAAQLAPVYKPLTLAPPKVMRIYRDVRFAKDKAPYKTHIGALLRLAGKGVGFSGNAVLYVHLGLDDGGNEAGDGGGEDEFVGVGTYIFDPAKLAKWRKAVSGKPGAELEGLVAKLRKAGYAVGGHDDYKRVPAGFAADHPRADFLKMKGLTGGFPEIPAGLLHKPALVTWLVKHGKALAPLVIWLHRNIG